MAWQLAQDGKSVIVGANGNPVWVQMDTEGKAGEPTEVDWQAALGTITRLNGENKARREKYESLEKDHTTIKEKLALFGELDPQNAKDALEKLQNIDQGKLLTAEKVDDFKKVLLQTASVEKEKLKIEYENKISEKDKHIATRELEINDLLISNQFAGSVLVKKLNVPGVMVSSVFKPNFKIENGQVVGYLKGVRLESSKYPGEVASFEEALQIMIDNFPEKDKLYPGTGNGGSGSTGGTNNRIGKVGLEQVPGMSIQEYADKKKKGEINFNTR